MEVLNGGAGPWFAGSEDFVDDKEYGREQEMKRLKRESLERSTETQQLNRALTEQNGKVLALSKEREALLQEIRRLHDELRMTGKRLEGANEKYELESKSWSNIMAMVEDDHAKKMKAVRKESDEKMRELWKRVDGLGIDLSREQLDRKAEKRKSDETNNLLQSRLQALTTHVTLLEQQVQALRSHLQLSERKEESLNTLLQQSKREGESVRVQKEQEIASLRGLLEQSQEEIGSLRGRLEQSEHRQRKSQEEIGSLRGLLGQSEERQQKSQVEIGSLRSLLEQSQEEIGSLRGLVQQSELVIGSVKGALEQEKQERILESRKCSEENEALKNRMAEIEKFVAAALRRALPTSMVEG